MWQEVLVSSDYPLIPSGDLDDRRVMKPSSVDFASVEYIVSKTCIAEAGKKGRSNSTDRTYFCANALVQDSPSGYGPIDT